MFRSKKRRGNEVSCSFCNKTQDQVLRLIAGPNVYICNECVHICFDVLVHGDKDQTKNKSLSWPRGGETWCALCVLPVTAAEAIAVENRGFICASCRSDIEKAIATGPSNR